MKTSSVNAPQKHCGMALLEVLLSSFIIATGIAAVLSMQALGVGTVQANRHFLQAEWLLYDMIERMKANPAGFAASLANMPQGQVNVDCESRTGCWYIELAAHDLAQWHWQLQSLLPSGRGEIVPTPMAGYPDAARVYRVLVRWHGSEDDEQFASMPLSSGVVVL
ncbi:type IV pilus modification protein PilV [Pseudohongiella sp.]|uniref:Type IV pilus modification protein PilV n=1 Tax=marine sediment metagenome TaxID=412755 RepID=A0A0F9VN89_9ZZZZ|nr:type IV pilus modification protein PilV [Pseudohongiella sp.]HDZ10294.1 type IV pilus modification protein PilV [Pseudohongiella sp.]HEA62083.1 type IV pilus modification protein PilV [Pseudohongiella sp.]